jgi:hypothetical protein
MTIRIVATLFAVQTEGFMKTDVLVAARVTSRIATSLKRQVEVVRES